MLFFYLLLINIVSFVIEWIDFKIFYKQVEANGGRIKSDYGIKPLWLTNVLTTIGGGFGAMIAFIILEPGFHKETIVSRIYTLWWMLVWAFILFLKLNATLGMKFNNFFNYIKYNSFTKFVVIVMVLINILTFVSFFINSLLKKKVIDTKFQKILALIGTTGAYIAMDFFNAKIWNNRISNQVQKGFQFVPILFAFKIVLIAIIIIVNF